MSETEWHQNVTVSKMFSKRQIEGMFKPDSAFMKRLKSGPLYGELGQPRKTPGMDIAEYASRCTSIDLANVACEIKDVQLVDVGEDTCEIKASVKFEGPMAEALENSFQSGHVRFGIRALVKHEQDEQTVTDIATFDVTECRL